jgi:hypothetical protein
MFPKIKTVREPIVDKITKPQDIDTFFSCFIMHKTALERSSLSYNHKITTMH